MKTIEITFAAALIALGCLAPVRAQTTEKTPPPAPPAPKKQRFLIGPEYGAWRPTDARVRQLFGSSWQNFGIGLGPVAAPDDRGVLQPTLRVVQASKNANRITLVPAGATYRKGLGSGKSYFGVAANLLFGRLEGPTLSGKWKNALGGAAFLGQSFGKKAYVEAGYNAYGKLDGYGVSGWNLAAGFRF